MIARTHPPVLVLSGVGVTAAVALRWSDALQAHFDVISCAPGTVGAPRVDTGLAVTTAEHAVALLDTAGADRAHVLGLSFGGAIAQELAIRYPHRVCSLVLGATSAGGALHVATEPATRRFVHGLGELPAEEGLWAAVPYLYAAGTCRRHAPRIGEDIARRLSMPLDPGAYGRQCLIARAHDAVARLAQITVPTLVIHGELDRIVPVDNGRRLAGAIAGARLVTLPDAAHAFPTDVPDVNRELVSFLRAHSPRQQGSAATRTARAGRA
jgi:pimeloyl-ACP methyl ester carboxylesterase